MNVLAHIVSKSQRPGELRCRWQLLCALALVLSGPAAFAAHPIPSPPRWLSLKEVLEKWDGEDVAEVRRKAEAGELTAQHYLGYCNVEGYRLPQDLAAGIGWYQRAGSNGYAPSVNNLGLLFSHGRGLPQDPARALKYFRSASEMGLGQADVNLGFLYLNGEGVPPDPVEAFSWFRRGADRGHPTAMVQVGRAYRFGQGVAKDTAEAVRWFEKSSAIGSSLAEFNLGLLYESGGPDWDPVKAVAHFRKAAEEGNADAMYKLSAIFKEGIVAPKDLAEAKRWLLKGAEAGSAWAQCVLGYEHEYSYLSSSLFHEQEPRPDIREAVRWYRKSADQNWAGGLYYLGLCYLGGNGVDLNEEQGLELIRRAADQGHLHAMRELVELYAKGVGEPRDTNDTTMRLLQRMVEQGDAGDSHMVSLACNALVYRYDWGLGTDRDLVAAAEWYCRAALEGIYGFSLADSLDPKPAPPSSLGTYAGRYAQIRLPNSGRPSQESVLVLSLYLKAALRNDPQATMRIGEMYVAGNDVPSSPHKAWAWFTLAASYGSADAAKRVAVMESRMSPAQREDAGRSLSGLRELFAKISRFSRQFSHD